MLVTLFLMMPEVPGRPGAVVPREALEIVRVGAEGGVGGGVETEERKVAKKRMAKRQKSMRATEASTAVREATQGATVVARSATKRCDAPDRCVAFAAERAIRRICTNNVTVFACEGDASGSDSDGVLSGEKQDAFVCDAPGKFFDVPGE